MPIPLKLSAARKSGREFRRAAETPISRRRSGDGTSTRPARTSGSEAQLERPWDNNRDYHQPGRSNLAEDPGESIDSLVHPRGCGNGPCHTFHFSHPLRVPNPEIGRQVDDAHSGIQQCRRLLHNPAGRGEDQTQARRSAREGSSNPGRCGRANSETWRRPVPASPWDVIIATSASGYGSQQAKQFDAGISVPPTIPTLTIACIHQNPDHLQPAPMKTAGRRLFPDRRRISAGEPLAATGL